MMRQSYESRRESWRVNLLRGLLQVENIESAILQNCLTHSVPIPLVSRKQAKLDTITHRIEFGNCVQMLVTERRNQLSNLTTDQKVRVRIPSGAQCDVSSLVSTGHCNT